MKFDSIAVLLIVLLLAGSVFAVDDITAAEQLMAAHISCNNLTDDQLVMIGEYYMQEQNGAAHMDLMNNMGGENSTLTRATHIALARTYYCDNSSTQPIGMMGPNGGNMGGMMQPNNNHTVIRAYASMRSWNNHTMMQQPMGRYGMMQQQWHRQHNNTLIIVHAIVFFALIAIFILFIIWAIRRRGCNCACKGCTCNQTSTPDTKRVAKKQA